MTDISNIDFESYKKELIDYLRNNQSQFKDYDFSGSNLNVLMDILSYNTFQNNFYNQMILSEAFLDSSKLKSSVVSHAKSLNYLPRSRKSSIVKIKLNLIVEDNASFVTIPERTKFVSNSKSLNNFSFYTNETYVVTPTNGEYISEEISLYEGILTTEKYFINQNIKFYKIQNENVDLETLKVYIKGSSGKTVEYKRADSLYNLSSKDRVYFIQMTDDNYEIYFGGDVFGNQPKNNEVLILDYLISSGSSSNGVNRIKKSESISGYNIRDIEVVSKAIGGTEKESIESIKFNAPKSVQIQERAVTEKDYEILLKRNFPEIQSISVVGGEKVSPPQYGKVILYIDTSRNNGISEQNKFRMINFLKERSPLGITPVIEQPNFFFLEVNTNINVDVKNLEKSSAFLKDTIKKEISDYNINYLNDFNKDFFYSKFTSMIDDIDTNILSNETTVRIFYEKEIELNKNNNFSIRFNNALTPIADYAIRSLQSQVPNHPYIPKLEAERADRLPTISSSNFRLDGKTVYMRDNGFGVLQIIQNTNDLDVIIRKNVGSVNYATGLVVVKNLYVNSLVENFKIYASTKNKDINCPSGSILSIDNQKIKINIFDKG